jgi:hypothetical protein
MARPAFASRTRKRSGPDIPGRQDVFDLTRGDAELIHDRSELAARWTPDLDEWFKNAPDTDGVVMINVHAARAPTGMAKKKERSAFSAPLPVPPTYLANPKRDGHMRDGSGQLENRVHRLAERHCPGVARLRALLQWVETSALNIPETLFETI